MNVKEILAYLERQVAPVKLSEDFCKKYSMYDNSGIIVDCGGNVKGALFCLELSFAAVDKAVENNCNLIVTHHPAIYYGVKRFDGYDPAAHAVAECVKRGISVISMHLNFDAAPEGIDYHLMRGLGGSKCEILANVDGGGYGRVYNISTKKFIDYVKEIEKTFNSGRVLYYGDNGKNVSKTASFCGAGSDERAIKFAKDNGADVFVSSDMKHHEIVSLVESGLCVVNLTHYCAENFGFNNIYLKIKDGLEIPSFYFTDKRFL